MTCFAHLKWLLSSIPVLDIWRIIDSLPLISIDQQFLLSLSPAGEASHQHLALQRRRALHPCTLRIGGDVRLALMVMGVHKSVDREVYAMWRQVISTSRINILERENKQISARSLLAAAPAPWTPTQPSDMGHCCKGQQNLKKRWCKTNWSLNGWSWKQCASPLIMWMTNCLKFLMLCSTDGAESSALLH